MRADGIAPSSRRSGAENTAALTADCEILPAEGSATRISRREFGGDDELGTAPTEGALTAVGVVGGDAAESGGRYASGCAPYGDGRGGRDAIDGEESGAVNDILTADSEMRGHYTADGNCQAGFSGGRKCSGGGRAE